MNLVERWFAELTNKKLRRSAHTSVRQLNSDIRAWIETWNDDPRPYVWTKTADQILESIASYCQRINDSRHSADRDEAHRRIRSPISSKGKTCSATPSFTYREGPCSELAVMGRPGEKSSCKPRCRQHSRFHAKSSKAPRPGAGQLRTIN